MRRLPATAHHTDDADRPWQAPSLAEQAAERRRIRGKASDLRRTVPDTAWTRTRARCPAAPAPANTAAPGGAPTPAEGLDHSLSGYSGRK
jgi:hypothetical protein